MDLVEEVLGDLDADEVADDEGGEYGEEGWRKGCEAESVVEGALGEHGTDGRDQVDDVDHAFDATWC